MKSKYDFSKGERGKFFKANADLRLPIYLDADIQRYLTERAADPKYGLKQNRMEMFYCKLFRRSEN